MGTRYVGPLPTDCLDQARREGAKLCHMSVSYTDFDPNGFFSNSLKATAQTTTKLKEKE